MDTPSFQSNWVSSGSATAPPSYAATAFAPFFSHTACSACARSDSTPAPVSASPNSTAGTFPLVAVLKTNFSAFTSPPSSSAPIA